MKEPTAAPAFFPLRWTCSATRWAETCPEGAERGKRLPRVPADAETPTLGLTESDPGRHLAERRHVRVVAFGVEELQALVDERLQHGQPRPGAGLGPLRLPDRAVDLQGRQRFLPVYRLPGERGEGQKVRRSHWRVLLYWKGRVDAALLRRFAQPRGDVSLPEGSR